MALRKREPRGVRSGLFSRSGYAKEIGVVSVAAAVLSLVVGRNLILSSKTVILAENLEVYSLDSLLENYSPYWQDKFQYFDFGIADSVYLYGLLALLARFLGLSYGVLQRVLLLCPHAVALIAMYALARYVVLSRTGKPGLAVARAASSVAAVAYALNPWIAVQPRDIALRYDYALTPLVLLLFFRIFESNQGRRRGVVTFCLTLSLIACFRYLLILLPPLLLYLVLPGGLTTTRQRLRDRLPVLAAMLLCFCGLSAGKFLSPVLYALQAEKVPYAESFHEELIGGATILEVLTTKVMSSPARRALDETYSDGTHQLFLIVSVLSFAYLILIRRVPTKHELLFPLVALLALPLSVLGQTPLRSLNVWLLTQAPLSAVYGRLLRHADWNSLPILVAVSVMFGLTTRETLRLIPAAPRRACLYAVPSLVAGLCGVSAWPLFTGDMNGYWTPSAVPQEFVRINDALRRERDPSHALWLPTYWESRATWAENRGVWETSAPTCNFDIRSSGKPSYLTERFYFFDYYNLLGPRPWHRPLQGYAGSNIPRIYENLNIRYAVLHKDVDFHQILPSMSHHFPSITAIVDSLKSSSSVSSVVDDGYLSVVRMNPQSREYRATLPVPVLGGLPVQGALVDAGVDLGDISLVYLENTHFSWADLQSLIRYSPATIMKGKTDAVLSCIAATADDDWIHPPYKHTLKHNHRSAWSRAHINTTVGDPLFHHALLALGLDPWSWDLDYGDGLALTSAPNAVLSFPVRIKRPGAYVLLARCFANKRGGAVMCSVDKNEFPIVTKSERNCFRWWLLSSLYLHSGKHTLTIRNVQGLNAVNLLCLVPLEDYRQRRTEVLDLLSSARCIHLYEAETDCYGSSTGIQTVRDPRASNGRLLRLARDDTVGCDLEVFRSGDYRVHVRMKGDLELTAGGETLRFRSDRLVSSSQLLSGMDRGVHHIRFAPRDSCSYLDAIWILPSENGTEITECLAVKREPAEIIHVRKANAFRTRLYAKATSPFLLSVAEGYDPLIVLNSARSSHKPIPLFGITTGFLVEETGDLALDLVLRPEKWARTGILISTASSICAIGYVLYTIARRVAGI